MVDKNGMLNIYLDSVCPACLKAKKPRHWLCIKCAKHMENFVEHDLLKTACAGHVKVIYRYLMRAKKVMR
jgi:hypothetical protein